MLEQHLAPLLSTLELTNDSQQHDANRVRDWFEPKTENLATDYPDLTYLCELPEKARILITDPVMIGWALDKLSTFTPRNEYQESMMHDACELLLKQRFINQHWKHVTALEQPSFEEEKDTLVRSMIAHPDDGELVYAALKSVHTDLHAQVYARPIIARDSFTIDVGHGIYSNSYFHTVASAFDQWLWQSQRIQQTNSFSIIVIDDAMPEYWYNRLIQGGFCTPNGQQGWYYDGETGLAALSQHPADVVLTDLNLGNGRLSGKEIAQRAFEIQKNNGQDPLVSVFSDSAEEFHAQWLQLGHLRSSNPGILMYQSGYSDNLKYQFSGTRFMNVVLDNVRFYKQN